MQLIKQMPEKEKALVQWNLKKVEEKESQAPEL